MCRNITPWSSPWGDEWEINVFVDTFPFPVLLLGEVHLQDIISPHPQIASLWPLAAAEKWDPRGWYFIWSSGRSQRCWPFTSPGEPECHKGSRWVVQAPEIWERDEAGGFQAAPTMYQYRHGKHQSNTKEEAINKFPFHCRPSSQSVVCLNILCVQPSSVLMRLSQNKILLLIANLPNMWLKGDTGLLFSVL